MPKYKIQFEVESNDYCGIFEYGTLANDEIDAIMESDLSNVEKEAQLDYLLVCSDEFKTAEEAVIESAAEEYSKEHDEDEEDYDDGISDLNSTSHFKVYLGEQEIIL